MILQKNIHTVLQQARYEWDEDMQVWVGSIPQFPGVLSQSESIKSAREQLAEILEDWEN